MSNGVERGRATPPEWDRLELAARRLLTEHGTLRTRLAEAERRVAELERAVREVSAGSLDPVDLEKRLERAESENRELRGRFEQAHEKLQLLLARLDFLHEER